MDVRHRARIRGPLVAAISTLLLVGSGSVALANDPSSPPASTSNAAEEPESTGPDSDLIEVQDESGAPGAAEGSDVAGAESDGPGGNADPAGDVNHEFDGEE